MNILLALYVFPSVSTSGVFGQATNWHLRCSFLHAPGVTRSWTTIWWLRTASSDHNRQLFPRLPRSASWWLVCQPSIANLSWISLCVLGLEHRWYHSSITAVSDIPSLVVAIVYQAENLQRHFVADSLSLSTLRASDLRAQSFSSAFHWPPVCVPAAYSYVAVESLSSLEVRSFGMRFLVFIVCFIKYRISKIECGPSPKHYYTPNSSKSAKTI